MFGVVAGDIDIFLAGVDAGHGGPQPVHRFRQQAAATSDIDDVEAVQRGGVQGVAAEMAGDMIADKFQAYRVELVQRREVAFGIPPSLGDSGETGNFVRRCR